MLRLNEKIFRPCSFATAASILSDANDGVGASV